MKKSQNIGRSRDSRPLVSRYLSGLRESPAPTGKLENLLCDKRTENCPESRKRLIESHLNFVVKVATSYRNLGLPHEDLLNEGNLGLVEAARRFDPERGNKFITYAVWWIRRSILKALSRQLHIVHMPEAYAKKVRQVMDTEASLRQSLGRTPTREEISEQMSAPPADVDRTLRQRVRVMSISPAPEDGTLDPFEKHVRDRRATSPEQNLVQNDLEDKLANAFGHLASRERFVLTCRFGLAGEAPETLQVVGDRMGLSREGVRILESRAKNRLRRLLDGRPMRARDRDPAPSKRLDPNQKRASRSRAE